MVIDMYEDIKRDPITKGPKLSQVHATITAEQREFLDRHKEINIAKLVRLAIDQVMKEVEQKSDESQF